MADFLSLADAAVVERLHSMSRDADDFRNEDVEQIAGAARDLILRLATQAQGASALRALTGPKDEPAFDALRSRLACGALMGVLAGARHHDGDRVYRDEIASWCVSMADALVAALGKRDA